MQISDEAVEAAAKVLYKELGGLAAPDVARTILEASAPHMLRDAKAEAWESGAVAAWEEVTRVMDGAHYTWRTSCGPVNPHESALNPHRSLG